MPPDRPEAELQRFLERHRAQIVENWAAERRAHPKSARMPRRELIDDVPGVLDDIIAALVAASRGVSTPPLDTNATMHALQRLEEGFDLGEVVDDYATLRRVLFQVLASRRPELVVPGLELLASSVDECIAAAVTGYGESRHRTLRALDRVSEVSLGSDGGEGLIQRLLLVLKETLPAVDSAALLLADGDHLRVRAAVGLIEKRDIRYEIRIGEGFAGTIAASRKALSLRSASTDPLVKSEFIRESGIRALYGVPLLRGSDVIGVAHMGSLTAFEFAAEDCLLFRTAANRAAALIIQAEQQAAVKEALEFRDRVIAIASHDVRTPLQAILMSANVLEHDGDAKTLAGRITRSARRIEGIVSGLVDYTRTRFKGTLGVNPEPMDLRAVVQHVIDEQRANFPRSTLRLEAEGDVRGLWDPHRLAQVASNLVTNALQHGDHAAPIKVQLVGEPEVVRLRVRNRGPKIPADVLAHVFEPFHKGAATQSQGFGLGLYIVSEIARAHGGSVSVRTSDEETVFEVTLPRMAPSS